MIQIDPTSNNISSLQHTPTRPHSHSFGSPQLNLNSLSISSLTANPFQPSSQTINNTHSSTRPKSIISVNIDTPLRNTPSQQVVERSFVIDDDFIVDTPNISLFFNSIADSVPILDVNLPQLHSNTTTIDLENSIGSPITNLDTTIPLFNDTIQSNLDIHTTSLCTTENQHPELVEDGKISILEADHSDEYNQRAETPQLSLSNITIGSQNNSQPESPESAKVEPQTPSNNLKISHTKKSHKTQLSLPVVDFLDDIYDTSVLDDCALFELSPSDLHAPLTDLLDGIVPSVEEYTMEELLEPVPPLPPMLSDNLPPPPKDVALYLDEIKYKMYKKSLHPAMTHRKAFSEHIPTTKSPVNSSAKNLPKHTPQLSQDDTNLRYTAPLLNTTLPPGLIYTPADESDFESDVDTSSYGVPKSYHSDETSDYISQIPPPTPRYQRREELDNFPTQLPLSISSDLKVTTRGSHTSSHSYTPMCTQSEADKRIQKVTKMVNDRLSGLIHPRQLSSGIPSIANGKFFPKRIFY